MLHHLSVLEQKALGEQWSYSQFLSALCDLELSERLNNRLRRLLQESQLPHGKTLSSFDFTHCPSLPAASLVQLTSDTSWLERAENLLFFGPSGVGKTHLAAAVGRCVIDAGLRVKFFSALALVQHLQQSKANVQLATELQKLDRFDLLIIDDLGYVQKSEAETSVLFELIAHRYECKSLLITANQPFSKWDSIFTDSVMTVAAVDRLLHHALIFEIQAPSFRQQQAAARLSSS
jgi:DNA replication protein DnaC